jgi:hypothetical protein
MLAYSGPKDKASCLRERPGALPNPSLFSFSGTPLVDLPEVVFYVLDFIFLDNPLFFFAVVFWVFLNTISYLWSPRVFSCPS